MKNEKIFMENLKQQLLKDKYLTCDDVLIKNREYIFLNDKEEVKIMKIGDIVYDFNYDLFKNSIFNKVERIYENNNF